MKKTDGNLLLLLTFLSAVCFLPLLGSFGIFDPSDGWYSEGAREMLELGDYLTPHLNYKPWLEKPILVYWLIIGSYKLFGVSEFAARFPSALCGTLLVLGTFVFSRQFVSQRAAFLAAITLLSSPLFLVVGHFALTDMPLALLVSASAALLFSALRTSRAWLIYPAYVVAGLAVLQKGPIGLFLTGIGLLLYLLVTSRSPKEFLQSVLRLNPFVGLLIVLVVSLPWYITESIITKGAFLQEFFGRQTFSRISGTLDHLLPFWFYIPVVLAGTFPWSLFIIGSTKQVIQSLRDRFNENQQLTIFCFLSSAAIFLFFSIVPSKLPTYIIPVLPTAAVVTGIYIDRLIQRGRVKDIFWTAPIMLTLAAIMPILAMGKFAQEAKPFASLTIVAIALVLSWLAYLILLVKNKLQTAIMLLTASSLIAVAICVPVTLTLYQRAHLKDFQDLVIWCKSADIHPMVFTSLKPSASFYTHYAVPPITSDEHFAKLLIENKDGMQILISDKKLQNIRLLPFKTSVQTVRHEGAWNLVKVSLIP
ncbi:MAG: glycosyltransferase family 39 protein [Candidatus Obscuribacterales bacterium]|nr:glycosyltransferase family 39 protein [Candidatus Obscuribacterales bacterium]